MQILPAWCFCRIMGSLYEQAGSAGKLLRPEELAALDALRLAQGESRGKGPWATAAGVRP